MTEGGGRQQPEELHRSYHVDPAWHETANRSLAVLIEQRLCPSCQARVANSPKREAQRAVSRESGLLATLQEHCSQLPNYRSAHLPLMEILFRVLLTHGNEPLSFEQLQQEASEWISPADGRDVSALTLRRILDADDYYGIRLFAAAPEPNELSP